MTHKHRDLLDKKNVCGVATNAKGEVVAFVEQKEDEQALNDEDIVPKQLDGKQTHVVEQEFELEAYNVTENAYPDRQGRFEPMVGGVQIQAQDSEGVGTLGSPPLRTESGELAALTNEHVVDPAQPGDPVYQPTVEDGEQIGTLADRTHVFDQDEQDEHSAKTADAALVGLDEPEGWTDQLLGLEDVSGFGEATGHDWVEKSGRTTGVTESGLLFSTDADLEIKVGEDEDGDDIHVEFEPVLISTLTTASGDSGSLWVRSEDRSIIGLHFAGGGGLSAAIPSEAVQDAFGELELADIEYETPDSPADDDDDDGDGEDGLIGWIIRRALRQTR